MTFFLISFAICNALLKFILLYIKKYIYILYMQHHKLKYPNKYPLKLEHNKKGNYKLYTITNLPASVDLRSKCPPIYDQGQLGSCTANALVGAYQFDNLSFYGFSIIFIL